MKLTGAQALIKFLEDEGVKYVFGYPGGAVLAIYDALLESTKITHVLVRQEQAAVHAASGYARITGRPGVCIATSGPGATNLVTGLATAYMDSIPVVAITGQVGTDMVGTDAFQEVDITGITMPITKHNYLVKDVKKLPAIIKEAFHIASTGRPGPVLIDLPKNVSAAVFDYKPVGNVDLQGYKPTYKGHPAQIKNLAGLLAEAERPLICAGGGVISSNAWDVLQELAETLNIPVTTTLMGLGSFPEDHHLSLGMLGLHGTPYANYAVQNCDLLLGIGIRFDDRVTSAVQKFAPQAKVVHIDIDPAEIGKNVEVDLPIVGDVKNVLSELLKKVAPKKHDGWLEQIEEWKKSYPMDYGDKQTRLRPQYILEKLGELTRGKAIITTDVGQHQMWTAQYYKFIKPRSFISSGGLGTMGYGLPAAVGAQLAAPDSLVVAVTGDGSFQMNMAELGTATEQKLPLKILLMNNSHLCLVKQLQYFNSGKRYSGVCFTGNPDFVKLATSYPGAVGLRIEKPEDVEPVLKEALSNGKLTLIDCRISDEELVYPVVPNNGALDEMIHFPGERQKTMSRVYIFDTTLRDGEQSPGVSLNIQEKLEIAGQLARLGVDVIEAGFPIASQGDFEAVAAIAQKIKGPTIAALARINEKDIDRAWEALQYAEKPRIHTFIATSEIHMKYKLKKTREEVLEAIDRGIRYAKRYTDDIEFSPEDGSRTDLEFMLKVVETAINAGATVINIPDTVGYATPAEFGKFIRAIKTGVPNMDKAILSVHCHNDLGMAVANSLAAVENGAEQVECAINGIGERAGNTALEEVVMALLTRKDYYGKEVQINTEEIYRTSRLVSTLTGMPVQYNKAIVGKNAFAHESGIHQDGVLKERTTYEIMDPAKLGIIKNNIVLGKHSGRHAFRQRLEELGFTLSEEELVKAFIRFKNLADRKKEITDKDLEAIVEEETRLLPEKYALESLHLFSGSRVVPTATVGLKIGDDVVEEAACGDGPVDAVFKAIDKICQLGVTLSYYNLNAITGGKDAMGEVTVKVDYEGKTYVGRGLSTDIIEASAKAYVNAINKVEYDISR